MRIFTTLLPALLAAAGFISPLKAQETGRVIVAYVTSWSDVTPDPHSMTHINYAFGHVNNTFDGVRIDNPDRLRSIAELKQQNPKLKVLLSVGGWGSGRFSEMAATDSTRRAFAADCRAKIKEYGLDGIDIDWEYPTSDAAGISSSPDDTRNYTLLMHELRRALGKKRLLTLASVSHAEYIDFKAVEPYVDFVNVMAYDIAVPPRHHAALYPSGMTSGMCGDEAVNRHIKAGIPARKLVLGMPFYGRGGKDPGGFCDYSKLVTLKEYTPQWDDEAKAPYLVDGDGRMVYTYETPRSIACKCEYIKQHGLLGAMYWEYGSDDSAGTLRKAVNKGIFGE